MVRRWECIDAITTATIWALVWTSVASWMLWGIALYYLASALLPVPGAPLASYVAAWSGSFLAGLIAVVSPAGLGAREGVIQVVLEKAGMTASDVLLVVVATRGWVTLMDVVPALAVLMLRRRAGSASGSSLQARLDTVD